MAMGFSSMFISHLEVNIDGNPFAVMGVVDTFESGVHVFWQIVVRKYNTHVQVKSSQLI